jgi:hypothetical protein
MNTRLILTAGIAGWLALAGPAHAQQQDMNSTQSATQQSAQMPAAAATRDDGSSYGGMPSTRGMSSRGYRPDSNCNTPGLSCNIYQGS